MSAQAHLTGSSAGIRLIALLTLYNRGDFDRLRAYIADSYSPAALDEQPAETRLDALRAAYAAWGKLRIEQVVGVGQYQAIVVAQAQRDGGHYLLQLAVEQDYPHRVTLYAWNAVAPEPETAEMQSRRADDEVERTEDDSQI